MANGKNQLFISLFTDSSSMPRPWNQKVLSKNPELATCFTHTYPYLLKQKFIKAKINTDLNNYAQRGSGIQTAVCRVWDAFSWLNSDISVFHFGINDCWLRGDNLDTPRVSKALFETYMNEMMANKRKYNPEQHSFFIGMSPTNAYMLAKVPSQNQVIHEYNRIMKGVLNDAQMNCHYLDMEAQFSVHGETILHQDGHHFSRTGHGMIADLLFEEVKKYV